MDTSQLKFTVLAPEGFGEILKEELVSLGANNCFNEASGTSFYGPLNLGFKIAFFSRLASRVILELKSVKIFTSDDL